MQRGLRADLHDAVAGALDRVGGADLGAGRLLAVHADHRHGLHALRRGRRIRDGSSTSPRCVSHSRARLHARLAADAAVGIDEEMEMFGGHGRLTLLLRLQLAAYPAAPSALRTRQPHTLYCGILLIGSCAATVSWFALFLPGPVVRNEDRVGADRGDDHAPAA